MGEGGEKRRVLREERERKGKNKEGGDGEIKGKKNQ